MNFRPYVRLEEALTLPYCVVTDWDPLGGTTPPLGKNRTFDLWQDMPSVRGNPPVAGRLHDRRGGAKPGYS
ncbi:hypothetical protein ACFX5Q_17005 [Mesorhizobium sp. IMUNJ 23033]|uniref:hypothetical protein n=1 Tax=Mesorhizobium sp. IMUNJ 23033 TaxID=3378039 RepID=UPI00384A89D7